MIDTKSTITAFKQLRSDLERVGKEKGENAVLNYFDFVAWLESKIEKNQ